MDLRQRTPDSEVSNSTSLLYHAFDIRGYPYPRTNYQGGRVIFSIHQEPHAFRCTAYGTPDIRPRGHIQRRFRTTPIDSKSTIVALPIPRVECAASGVVLQVEVSFANPRNTYTKSFEGHALKPSESTSGPVEGTNSKIKTMKHWAYRFRDPEFFKLKILAIYETTYALVGGSAAHFRTSTYVCARAVSASPG